EKATVSYDCDIAPVDTLMTAIEAAGYDPVRETVVLDIQDESFDAQELRSSMLGVQGVTEADVSVETRRVSVSFPAGAVDTRQLRKAAQATGIELLEREPEFTTSADEVTQREQRTLVY